MRVLASCLLLLLIAPWIASAKHPWKDVAVEFEDLPLRDQFSLGFYEPQDLVIRNPRQWCRFWQQVHVGVSPVPPCDLSGIDFRREVVIASALGGRPNGCFAAGILSITRVRGPRRLQVLVEERVPGRGCLCTQALVWPVAAVAVPKPVGRVEFIHGQSLLRCSREPSPR
jgi:hypothetical protein